MYKIASLLPSATEICCALGLKENLVAVSHECDFPEGLQHIPRITSSIIPPNLEQKEIDDFVKQAMKKGLSLYSVDEEKMNVLQPDIIVTQGLCSVCAVSETTIETALRGNKMVNCLFIQKSYLLAVFPLMVYVVTFDSSPRKQTKRQKQRYIFQMKNKNGILSQKKEMNRSYF